MSSEAPTRHCLLCFSHLRWNFVFQRPQHLLQRAARTNRVFYFEEPLFSDGVPPSLDLRTTPERVVVVQPHLPWHLEPAEIHAIQRRLLDGLIRDQAIQQPVLWFYTPAALGFAGHLQGTPTIYDCMDELSAFAGADPALPEQEQALLRRADLVFTGGYSLFEAKRALHARVHAFPSGVDTAHFRPARLSQPDPADQAAIPHPRLGFYGVLDERLDRALLAETADLRPQTHFILLGPTAKLDPSALPTRPNIHYLGPKSYDALPGYLANWDAAMMPFARNAATRFISPTKTPEFLAAGLPVVSTPIADVVRQYGAAAAVRIASTPESFAQAIDVALCQAGQAKTWLVEADAMLAGMEWDAIWARMAALITPLQQPLPQPAPMVMRRAEYDVVVVGAGFAGAVLAERLAAGSNQRVLVVDRRPHIGGNAYDAPDAAGILIHPYGPHIFHTNAASVFDYLSRFTEWRRYEHRVLAQLRGMLLPIPINRTTINRFFGVDLSEADITDFLASKAEPRTPIRNSADVVLAAVGRELYEALFQGYTRKQWGLDPSELDRSVTARLPTRTNDDDRYFTDRFQAMPLHGFTRLFERMLDHPNITVATGTEWREIGPARANHLVFTGPIDEFFGHRFGKLPYRSLEFRHETVAQEWVQPVGVINHPSETVPYTRITEFKHLTGQSHPHTSLCYEFPAAEGAPYYPIPRPENASLFQRYQALADATDGVTFAGRLGTYRYYNMDQVVAQALATYARLTGRRGAADLVQEAAE